MSVKSLVRGFKRDALQPAWPQEEAQNMVSSTCGNRDNHSSLGEVCGEKAYLTLPILHRFALLSCTRDLESTFQQAGRLPSSNMKLVR
jgi:hypothetical protein